MNKFLVFPCIDRERDEDDEYKGKVVSFANSTNISFMLFFPIADQYANLINYSLNKESNPSLDMQLFSVYQTMLDSWKAGDRYLSGILFDLEFDEEYSEEIIAPSLIISDAMGNVDAILKVNFVHAVMLAAMERKEVMVTNELLNQLLPMDEDDDEEFQGFERSEPPQDQDRLPNDKNIVDIARSIMSERGRGADEEDEGDDE